MKALDALHAPLSGTSIIEASAGTGKTFTICTLFARLVAERGLAVRDILVVTFTEAATAELRERIRARLFCELDGLTRADPTSSELTRHLLDASPSERRKYEERLRFALETFDQAAIFTIHGFCHRVLREHAFECEVDFEAELIHDAAALFEEVSRDFWAQETYALDPLLLRLIEPEREPKALSRILAAVAPRPWARVLPETAPVFDLAPLDRFRAALKQLSARWRTDRESIARILREDPGLNRNRYRVASVPKKLAEIDAYLSLETPPDPVSDQSFLTKLTESAITAGTKAKATPPSSPFFTACTEWDHARVELAALYEPYLVALRRRFVDTIHAQIPRKKLSAGLQFFDDLLSSVDRALQGPRGPALAEQLRARYRAALVDEFQDTDLVQYRIFQAIFGRSAHPMFLIGDPKQAIYAFRGADIFAYLAAVEDAPHPPTTLDVNWRSDPMLVRAVDALFRRSSRPFLLEGIELPEVHARPGAGATARLDEQPVAPLQFRFVSSLYSSDEGRPITRTAAREALPGLVASDITRLLASKLSLGGRVVEPSDIAVLVRSNDEAERYQQALALLGVPSVSSHGGSVFESPEAAELGRVLAALIEPGRGDRLKAALGTRLLGLRAGEIAKLALDEAAWDAWVSRFRLWHESWQNQGFIRVHRELLAFGPEIGRPPVSTRLLGETGGERCLTNHLHLAELLHRAEQVNHLGMQGLSRWFERARASKFRATDEAELRLETDERAVTLVTIHKSKGLEYPVVYCPSLWTHAVHEPRSQRFDEPVLAYHDPDDAHRLKLELRLDERAKALSQREQRAEALRLTYVALTRAKHLCVVITGAFEDLADSALGYLVHQQPSASDPWSATLAHIRSLDGAARLAETMALAAQNEGAISVGPLETAANTKYEPVARVVGPLRTEVRQRVLRPSRVVSSYSALVRSANEREPNGRPVLDRGEAELLPTARVEIPARSPSRGAMVPLADFPRTSTAGSCFHAIYEDWDFQDPSEASLLEITREKLGLFGYDPVRWTEPVAEAIRATVETPLRDSPGGFRLADIPRAARTDELPFLISARDTAGFERGPGLSPSTLAAVFEAHRSAVVPETYLRDLGRLEFPTLNGFLKGYVDLVFEREHRFYVADYKSNFLGSEFSDYAEEQLSEAMSHGHYFLQYHLYVVALHRFLALRRPGYDYERDFGGVFYLFIKGMSPATGPGAGIFFDRPSAEMVRALDALLGQSSDQRARA